MLVWVSSFPRSGNTFLRIILHRLYDIRTSTVYDVDGVAERLGNDLIGYTDRPGSLAEMRASDEPHFVKTHRQRDADVDENDQAICLVRDGRDALVSWARQASEESPSSYEAELRERILRDSTVGTGSWGSNVLSWLRPPAPHRIVLRYEDLIRDPRAAVTPVIATVAPALTPRPDATIPTLDELRQHDHRFFRRGRTGSHQDELPAHLHKLFWSRTDNRAAMALLGHAPEGNNTRVVLVDDLRSFVDGRNAEVARTSAAGVRLLDSHRHERLDELWLDHDLGEDDTIWPVIEVLERVAFDGRPLDIGVINVHSANPAGASKMAQALRHWGYRVRIASGSADVGYLSRPDSPG